MKKLASFQVVGRGKTSRPAASRRYRRTTRGQYLGAVRNARRRGVEWRLTFEQFAALRQLACSYCEGALPATSAGLDRLSSRKGYTPENVVPCCGLCNSVKSDLLRPDAMRVVGAFLRFLKKYNPESIYAR